MKKDMVKKQVYLTREEEKMLIRESFIEGVSQAEVIRRALDSYVAGKAGRAKERKDPLYKFIGAFGDTEVPEGFSSDLDKYLYDGEGG